VKEGTAMAPQNGPNDGDTSEPPPPPPPHLAVCDAHTCESVDLGPGAGVHLGGALLELGSPLARQPRLVVLEFQL